jgi:hypothetical protein
MIKKILLIGVMVLAVFLALSENEKWIQKGMKPHMAKVEEAIQSVNKRVGDFVNMKKEQVKEKINHQLDIVEARIDDFMGLKDSSEDKKPDAEKSVKDPAGEKL